MSGDAGARAASIDLVLPSQERFTPSRGGAIATVNRELAQALLNRNVQARVVSPAFKGDGYGGIPVACTNFGRDRSLVSRALRRARRAVTGHASDSDRIYREEVRRVVAGSAVVVHNDPVLATSLADQGMQVVLWLHNLLVGHDGEVLADLPESVSIVTVSDYVRRWTAATHGLTGERITVIHNGVDSNRFRPPAKRAEEEVLRVVCHGRIDPNKGQVLAAEAVAAARSEGVPVELTVIGAPQTYGMATAEVESYLRSLDRALQAAGAHVTGRISPTEIPAMLQTFDVALLLPTVPDPFPLAGLEAMASGCAVVAAPLGGVDEMVGDAALRVEAKVESVAEAIAVLATDPARLDELRARSRARALEFTWDAAASRLLALLDHEEKVVRNE